MAVLRKVALGLLLATSAAALLLAALELWNYRQWANLPSREPAFRQDDRARILQDRVEFLTKRVGDMELLVLILLGTSGLYAIVFVTTAYFSAASFTRQAAQTVSQIQDQIGLAMGDLRELQEQTEEKLKNLRPVAASRRRAKRSRLTIHDRQIAEIAARWRHGGINTSNDQSKLELLTDESTAAHLDATAGSELGATLPILYLGFSRIYTRSDPARSRFYLDRALRLAPPKSPPASEIHYELACRFAASRDFARALTNSPWPSSISSKLWRNGWPTTLRKAANSTSSPPRRRSTKPSTICC
jgi:hypothetical protein